MSERDDVLEIDLDGLRPELYSEVQAPRVGAADRLLRRFEGLLVPLFARARALKLEEIVSAVRFAEADLRRLDDDALREKARELSLELKRAMPPPLALGARALALIKEASGRTLGMRHHDVQLMGGWALVCGMLAEMNTGEGKTLTATLPAITAALGGMPVHVVTVNDYLARRDAATHAPLYGFFGLKVGVVVEGMPPAERRAAYACDVTYCTNKELAFDYLNDRLVLAGAGGNLRRKLRFADGGGRDGGLLLRGLHFAVVDEADSILIDEARTPLILSGEVGGRSEEAMMRVALALARTLDEGRDFVLSPADRRVDLTAAGAERLETEGRDRGGLWASRVQREDLIGKALSALHLMVPGEQYVVKDGKVAIVDEYTGRIMADRSWSDGLHQLVEIKEGLAPSKRRVTLARITYQRFVRRYRLLGGMSGTVQEVADEMWEVYRLKVARVPPHRPPRLNLVPDVVFPDDDSRWQAIARVAERLHARGSPVLIGTRSVAASTEASRRLAARGIPHRVLNAVDDAAEAEIVALAGMAGQVTVATNMAGRGTDIVLTHAVAEAGGLHVLISERHESRRIDRQLAGRAARQGQPGAAVAMLSLDDQLMREVAPPWLRALAAHAVAHRRQWLARMAMREAQRVAEARNRRIRRALLTSDESLDDALAFAGAPE